MLTVGNVSVEFSLKIRAKTFGLKRAKQSEIREYGKIWTPASGELCGWEAEPSGHLPQVVVPELIYQCCHFNMTIFLQFKCI